ncbi:MAG TPA: hypothetical protein VFK33_02160 [Bacillales bacterium]|nr:hypothetical protein [Bacillales bacterium]
MKKLVGTMMAGCLGFALVPLLPVTTPTGTIDQSGEKNKVSKALPQREFIIRDSVNEPLPPKAEKIKAMESGKEPQTMPNYMYDNPVVLTKMPHNPDKKIQPSYVHN